jgi:hypothetical protein
MMFRACENCRLSKYLRVASLRNMEAKCTGHLRVPQITLCIWFNFQLTWRRTIWIATILRAGRTWNRGSNPDRDMRLISFPKRPPGLLSNRYPRFTFPVVKQPERQVHLPSVVPRLRISGAISPIPLLALAPCAPAAAPYGLSLVSVTKWLVDGKTAVWPTGGTGIVSSAVRKFCSGAQRSLLFEFYRRFFPRIEASGCEQTIYLNLLQIWRIHQPVDSFTV